MRDGEKREINDVERPTTAAVVSLIIRIEQRGKDVSSLPENDIHRHEQAELEEDLSRLRGAISSGLGLEGNANTKLLEKLDRPLSDEEWELERDLRHKLRLLSST